jgi:hypothetical protein
VPTRQLRDLISDVRTSLVRSRQCHKRGRSRKIENPSIEMPMDVGSQVVVKKWHGVF